MKEPRYHGVNELRRMFLEFFEGKGYLAMKSFSLVPHNGSSLPLINSDMTPLKPYFTGQEIPPRNRVTTCQKCIRTGDIENIGKTARHDAFFEMLGNFSFRDYFKAEVIHWTWESLTDVVELDSDRLYPSVYLDDDETFGIWNEEIGIPAERIFKFGKEDNFREHGSGPYGPCSEVYYDRGGVFGYGKSGCTVGCGCNRYIKVWNNVFIQFDNDRHGHYTELEHKNTDTGMGLKRLAVMVQGTDSLFTIGTSKTLLDRVCQLTHIECRKGHEADMSLRTATDHVKPYTFMTSGGIMPSNGGGGYVLRRLLRRAARRRRELRIEDKLLVSLPETVIELPKDGYPELEEKQTMIFKVLSGEEEKFNKTTDQGLSILGEIQDEMQKTGSKCLSGANAFKLCDTYRFPLDLTKGILERRGCAVDEDGFTAAMEEQEEKTRKACKTTNYMGANVTVYQSIDPSVTTEFIGCDRLTTDPRVTVLTTGEELVQALTDGQKGAIIVEQTPFYGTMDDQRRDTGVISNKDDAFKVEDTIHLQGSKIGHVGIMTRGMFQVGESVTLSVCTHNHALTCKNHGVAHLLQKALCKVLGDHVEQASSYVDTDRLRFDSTYFSAMTPDEIRKMEELVNQEIQTSLPVVTQVTTLEEAKKTGTVVLSGEKYGDKVHMVHIGDFSTELCGDTRMPNTDTIAYFEIISRAGIAAGVRHIETLTSEGLMKHYQEVEEELQETTRTAKTTPSALTFRIQSPLEEIKTLHSESEKLESRFANDSPGDVMNQVRGVNELKALIVRVTGTDISGMRNLGDQLEGKLGEGVIVLACEQDGKVNLVATATDPAQEKDTRAGNLTKAIAGPVGGGSDGRPNMAQASGKSPAGIGDALKKAVETVEEQTKQYICR